MGGQFVVSFPGTFGHKYRGNPKSAQGHKNPCVDLVYLEKESALQQITIWSTFRIYMYKDNTYTTMVCIHTNIHIIKDIFEEPQLAAEGFPSRWNK